MAAPFTRIDYNRLPEGFPAQLIEGAFVKEPAHTYGQQNVVGRLRDLLVPLVGSDLVVTAPADVVIDDHNVFQPDVVVLREIPPLNSSDVGIPRLAFEVLSPTSSKRDRQIKCPRLLQAGTEESWILDPAAGAIEVWRIDGMRRTRGTEASVSTVLDTLRIVPAELFRRPQPA